MIRKLALLSALSFFSILVLNSQSLSSTASLFRQGVRNSSGGRLNIIQEPALDSLIGRYILARKAIYADIGYLGMDGFRIQIYSSSNRNAREESAKARASFISRFPDIVSYSLYADPGYFKIRVGDFRTKAEATRLFLTISRDFPDAYIVPDIINFPDQIK